MNIRSRTSAAEIRATNEPCCGSITTRFSNAQPADRRRDREPRDAEPFAQRRLVDQLAGFDPASENRFLELVVDLIGLAVDALSHGFYQLRAPPRGPSFAGWHVRS